MSDEKDFESVDMSKSNKKVRFSEVEDIVLLDKDEKPVDIVMKEDVSCSEEPKDPIEKDLAATFAASSCEEKSVNEQEDDLSTMCYEGNESDFLGSSSYAAEPLKETSMNDLINDTALMSIDQDEDEGISLAHDAPELEKQRSVFEAMDIRKKNEINDEKHGPSRKRSFNEMTSKQSQKINDIIDQSQPEIQSAMDVKNVAYNAWTIVKREKTDDPIKEEEQKLSKESSRITKEAFPKVFKKGPKPTFGKLGALKEVKSSPENDPEDIEECVKDSRQLMQEAFPKVFKKCPKPSTRKSIPRKEDKSSKDVPEKTPEDIEECKMAFLYWKRKKDELSRHQAAEKYRNEEKKRWDSLTNEALRKSHAEAAYSAWISHKLTVAKLEKKKNEWLVRKQNEKFKEKVKRNEEAEKVYFEWLKNKFYCPKNFSLKDCGKPPWTPPGKT